MRCEMNYCIYNNNLSCTLDEIAVNDLGMCDTSEWITIPDDTIRLYKKKRLQELKKMQ